MANNGSVTHELDFVTADRFYVGLETGELSAAFSECSGLGVKVKTETYLEGGVNEQQRIFLGQPEFTEVTLKRGITNDLVFWEWVKQILDPGPKKRRNVNIMVFNQAGEPMQCWTLIGAVPVGWRAPALQANSNTVAIEELSLAYEGLKIDQTGSNNATALEKRTNGYFASN